MKKGLTILIAVIIVFACMILVSNVVSANDLLIGREVQITGTGIINADLAVGTESEIGSGIELNEQISTPGGGFVELSLLKYYSQFGVGMYSNDDSVKSSAEIEYVSMAEILNAKRTVYTRNYILGAVMGMKANGDSGHEISMYSDMHSMDAEVSGENIGELKLFQKVVDIRDHRNILVYDVIELDGVYTIDWGAFVKKIISPTSSENWLGCP